MFSPFITTSLHQNSSDTKRNMTWKLYLKWTVLLLAIWMIYLIRISRDLIQQQGEDQMGSYEEALKKFKINASQKHEAWNLIGDTKYILSSKYKLSAVRSQNFPPGNNGSPVLLKSIMPGLLETEVRKGWREHNFNQFVSDLISLDRVLPDVRNTRCPRTFSSGLPKASVIITFYNEAWSTLLRTVHSVINKSPEHLLDKIILVDDNSAMPHLKRRLGEYIEALAKVTLIRTTQREGLIRARILGTKYVNSPVLIFLDSHCECTDGWLEPLLERIAKDPTIVVSPTIDHIDDDTFEYIAQKHVAVGGFNWELKFIWRHIPKHVFNGRELEAIKTPTISGGLFAINNIFFQRIGYYDEEFEIWGAENLELSFKTWMCGGSLEIVPCSHVGHVFRKTFPYKTKRIMLKNFFRLAEIDNLNRETRDCVMQLNITKITQVWMDDYAKYFYQRIGNLKEDFGDVSKRTELRQSLQCKSFEWYLRNVYPEMEIPTNVLAYGQIHDTNGVCLDSVVTPMDALGTVHPKRCHGHGGSQFWQYTNEHKIKRDQKCLDFIYNSLLLTNCREQADTQKWIFEKKTRHLRHTVTRSCLKNGRFNDSRRIIVDRCFDEYTQVWIIS